MPLSWNEIKDRALAFSKEWAQESAEDAEAKSFWDDFFNIFGISRRRIASFEVLVKKLEGKDGFIDLLWKGVLLIEHKSRGRNLDRAYAQAIEYFPGLKERDLPRYVLVSDFARFRLHDLDQNQSHEFALEDLHKNTHYFGFIAGYQSRSFGQEDPVNIKASIQLGHLHDSLKESGYQAHALEKLLVRVLFCLFADDTGIFDRHQFREFIEQRTNEDGTDLGIHLAQIFQVLDTPIAKRQSTLDEQVIAFPYVNGQLFSEVLPLAAFNKKMRETLLDCCAIDWSRISPAIFGSLFQSIMDKQARRSLGAHYTTEINILKVLKPLFLDSLQAEFDLIKHDSRRLNDFQKKLSEIRVLDPACGCGNFLVVAYRELRLLEINVLRERYKKSGTAFLNIADIVRVDVDQFYGIEIEEFPGQIAKVALWLMDHQMNLAVSQEFGQYFARLPLVKTPRIVYGNALQIDWAQVVKPETLSYIVGNPPFIGAKYASSQQRTDIKAIFLDNKNAGLLDYVSCWYRKAADFMYQNPVIQAAFVSTNSITQGELVEALWPDLLARGLRINFAHRTFPWSSEAGGKAAVMCVIIGFALKDETDKWIFTYENILGVPQVIKASTINPYLVDAPNIFLEKRKKPIIKNAPKMLFGSMPNDGGNLLLTTEEKHSLLLQQPECKPWIRPLLGSYEFINGRERWCLWLGNIEPKTLGAMPAVLERVNNVKKFRLQSNRSATRQLADMPTMFGEIRQPLHGHYLLVPRVSSERRPFIPLGFMPCETISTDANLLIPYATVFHFGVLSSTMHMAWVRAVCGRLKSDYRYSAGIVYNNFPWPEASTKQKETIEIAAQKILDARLKYPNSTLADLYSPLTMPAELTRAHQALDRAVDASYAVDGFANDALRVSFLFGRYQELVAGENRSKNKFIKYYKTIAN